MSLIRFESDSQRGPSAQLWQGLVDWVRGSLATALGPRDFEDFTPFLGFAETSSSDGATGGNGGTQVTSAAGTPTVTLKKDRYGVVNITESAGANESVGLTREIHLKASDSPITVVEARVKQNADANSPQLFVGFSDVPDPDDVFASGDIASGGTQNTLGLLHKADETIDLVSVAAGTAATLKTNIGLSFERTDGPVRLGLRVEQVTTDLYRLVPCVNGKIARNGTITVASSKVPAAAMRPVVVTTVAETTAPSVDVDWIYSASK